MSENRREFLRITPDGKVLIILDNGDKHELTIDQINCLRDFLNKHYPEK